MTDRERLTAIAERLRPCPTPDVVDGYDMCPCGRGGTWPCAVTEAAWFARGLDPAAESTRLIQDAFRTVEDECGLAADDRYEIDEAEAALEAAFELGMPVEVAA